MRNLLAKTLLAGFYTSLVVILAGVGYVLPKRMLSGAATGQPSATASALSAPTQPNLTEALAQATAHEPACVTWQVAADVLHIRDSMTLQYGTANVVGYWRLGDVILSCHCETDADGLLWVTTQKGWSVARNGSEVYLVGTCEEEK